MTRSTRDSGNVATMRTELPETEWRWLTVAEEAQVARRHRVNVYHARLLPSHPVHQHSTRLGKSVGVPEHLIRAWWADRVSRPVQHPTRTLSSLARRGLIDGDGRLTEKGEAVASWQPTEGPGHAQWPYWEVGTQQQWEALKSIASEPTTTEGNASDTA